MLSHQPAVLAESLKKRYGETNALDGLDLTVRRGTVFGLLGPNGAGKTTAVRALATLLKFDTGRAEIAGYDVVRQAEQVRYSIGVAGQYAAVDEVLSGRRNLEIFGRLYHLNRPAAANRAGELLEQFDLTHAADRPVKTYSGGMRRRLDLAASLILRPQVLFLDEPTTGLDPRSRSQVWESVRSLVADGTTVLLTTQYLDEADQLADQIAVINAGRVIAEGTPDQLKAEVGGDQIDLVIDQESDFAHAASIVGNVSGSNIDIDRSARRIRVPATNRARTLTHLVSALSGSSIEVADVSIHRSTLDDVFLNLTGQTTDQYAQEETA
jgi:ABC-2 type transport system ATP-binding protein